MFDLKILIEKMSIRLNETTHRILILFDPVDDEEDPGPQTSDL
jgi:hypothetical protein